MYLRLMSARIDRSDAEHAAAISSALGEIGFRPNREIVPHPKGGFTVHVSCEGTVLDELLSKMDKHGYKGVL